MSVPMRWRIAVSTSLLGGDAAKSGSRSQFQRILSLPDQRNYAAGALIT
jgi:hypothetical protein